MRRPLAAPSRSRFMPHKEPGALATGLSILLIFGAQLASGQAKATKIWTAPHTADGQPDIQGIWSNATITPVERPSELATKQFFTEQEGVAYEKQVLERNNMDRREGGAEADVGRAYNDFWWDRGTHIASTRRTSLVIDPPDGKIPPLTPEAQKRLDDSRAQTRLHPADGPENRSLSERCLLWATAGPPMLPGAYNNNYQIAQAPGYVMLVNEMAHTVRTIPLDGRPHLPSNIRQWMGDSRGHWDGTTLVVDTTNFTDKTRFRGTGPNMHLVERFTRSGPNTLLYEFTVEDPAFTKPWTVQIPSIKTEGPIYEYACHEGNYGMTGILAGARAEEAKKGSR